MIKKILVILSLATCWLGLFTGVSLADLVVPGPGTIPIDPGIGNSIVDIRPYGAVCNGASSTGVAAAVAAAVAAGATRVLLPANCTYVPPSNTTPTGIEIDGANSATSIVSVANRATDSLYMGPKAILNNVGIISTFCDTTVTPPSTQKVCPVGEARNIADVAQLITNWTYQGLYLTGNSVTGPTGATATDSANAAFTMNAPGGDSIYTQTGADGASGMRVVTTVNNDQGIFILDGFLDGTTTDRHSGIFVKEFANAHANDIAASIRIDRISDGSDVTRSLQITDLDSTGTANTSPFFDLIAINQSTGNLLNIFHGGHNFSGNIIEANAGNAGGVFSGNFLAFVNNGTTEFTLNSAGTGTFVGGVIEQGAVSHVLTTNNASDVIGAASGAYAWTTAEWSNDVKESPTGCIKSRATTVGGHVTVQTNDHLCVLHSFGDDGTNYTEAGQMGWNAVGTIAAGQVPSQWFVEVAISNGSLINGLIVDGNAGSIITNGHQIADTSGNLYAVQLQTSTALITATNGSSTAAFTANMIAATGGPTTTAQNGWLKMKDSSGATIWIPVWK